MHKLLPGRPGCCLQTRVGRRGIVAAAIARREGAPHGEILAEIARLVEAGLLSPRVDDRRFDLAMADTAFDLVAEGKGRGKIVLEWAA